MDALFDKLPYDKLEEAKAPHYFGGAFLLAIVVFALFFFTLYSSWGEEYSAVQEKKTKTENKLKDYQTLLANKVRVHDQLTEKKGQLAQFKKQFPKADEISGFMSQVAEIGSALDVEVILLERRKAEENDFFMEIPIEMEIRGGFYKTFGFLNAMQNLLNLVEISEFKMEAKKAKEQEVITPDLITSSVAVAYAYIDGAEDRAKKKKG